MNKSTVDSAGAVREPSASLVRQPRPGPWPEQTPEGPLAQLSAALQQSPVVQAQLSRREQLDTSSRVSSLQALQNEINGVEPRQAAQALPETGRMAASCAGAACGAAPVQRRIELYQDETKKKHMGELADTLNTCVATAKAIVDSNPLLTGVPGADGGYLGAWVECFTAFVADGEIPNFFYARYGYAIETIATSLFLKENHKGYLVTTQLAQGSTRPDFVISDKVSQIAWLDITSENSVGHIKAKQGGGWSNRPYVAEILYDMPAPASFAKSASGKLTKKQKEALEKADAARAQRELEFDKGMKAMGLLLGEAYKKAYEDKKDKLSRGDVRKVTIAVCEAKLGKFVDGGITRSLAAAVLGSIESIEVMEDLNTGQSWALWAFKGIPIRWQEGRSLLWDYGKSLG